MKLSREFKIGCFVLAVLVASFFVINFLRGKDIFNREMTVMSFYENIDGLVPSDPVYIKGYKAGSVISVEYLPEKGHFEVACSVLKKFRIPSDSRMTIYSRDIMGGKAVRIDPGLSADHISDGAVLAPATEPDMLASLAGQAAPLLSRISSIILGLTLMRVSVLSPAFSSMYLDTKSCACAMMATSRKTAPENHSRNFIGRSF